MTMMMSKMIARITTRIMPESMNSNLGNWKACKQLCLYYQPFIVIYHFPIFESGERRVTHTGLTYDKKCGRIGGRGWVDPQGGGSLLLVVLGVLGMLQYLYLHFGLNFCCFVFVAIFVFALWFDLLLFFICCNICICTFFFFNFLVG